MNTIVNGVLITGAQGVTGSQGVTGATGAQGKNGIQGVSNILPFTTGINISSAYLCSPSAVLALNINTLYATPFLPSYDATYNSLSIFVTTGVASSSCQILIYSDLNGSPNNLLFQSAIIDCSTTGKKTVSVSGTFSAGTAYWLCIWSSANAISIRCIVTQALSSIRLSTNTPLMYLRRSVTYSTTAPNPFGAGTPVTSNAPLVVITLN